jgi:peptidylprolyl isomerase
MSERAPTRLALGLGSPPMLRLVACVLVLLVIASVAACGDDEAGNQARGSERTAKTTESPSPAAQWEALHDTAAKPEIPKPTGSPPRRLVREDIVRGKGAAAQPGDNVTLRYVGVTFSTGDEFDSSWDRGTSLRITVGAHQVIEGWDAGLVGMRKGGRRMLTIPPELAYGTKGSAVEDIGPNETLVLVVDLVALRPG